MKIKVQCNNCNREIICDLADFANSQVRCYCGGNSFSIIDGRDQDKLEKNE